MYGNVVYTTLRTAAAAEQSKESLPHEIKNLLK
jgi:hypothetical protein